MRSRSDNGAGRRRLATRAAMLLAAAAVIALLVGPAQAAPGGCETGYLEVGEISGPVTAGAPFAVTVSAFDCEDALMTDYAGTVELSGASDAPDGTEPDYGELSFDGGQATAQVTLYAAETSVQLTASDGDLVEGTSEAFDVLPAALDDFTFGSIASQTAGEAFGVSVTAYDEYENIKTDYEGPATLDGEAGAAPGNSPSGTPAPDGDTPPDYGAFAWVSGVGSATVTLYAAEDARKLAVTDDTTAISAASDPFDVGPGVLGAFEFDPVGTEFEDTPSPGVSTFVVEADTPFGVSITAYDEWGNVKTDYTEGAELSGLASQPPADPTYGSISWQDGVGTASVTAVALAIDEALTVEDADADVSALSDPFDVVAEICGSDATCEGSTPNGSKKVRLSSLSGETASIGFLVPSGTIPCLLKDGSTLQMTVGGALALVNPPPGYTVADPLTLTMTLTKEAQPSKAATGVANFVVCLSKNRGLSFEQVIDCRSGKQFKPADEIPCISSRKRLANAGLEIKVLITSTDPWGGIS